MKYWWITIATIVVCIWVIHVNDWMFLQDPQASQVLSHKQLPIHFHLHLWENVLRVHVISSSLAMVTGVIGLLRPFIHRLSRAHRWNGWVYILCVCLGALTAGYLAPTATGGQLSSVAFNLMEMGWVGSTVAAFIYIRKGRLQRHKRWMMRSYAFALANLAIHIWLWFTHSLLQLPYNTAYTLSVWVSGGFNLLVLEIFLRLSGRFRGTNS